MYSMSQVHVERSSGFFVNETIVNSYSRSKRETVDCSRPKVFRCDSNNECITADRLCDGQQDCTDSSDENIKCRERIQKCPDFSFRCAYGACVDGDSECDGKVDCVDGSDERTAKCPKAAASNTCGSTKHTCTNGQCIPKYALCDGNKDCTDGSDETYEVCSKTRCPDFSFQCQYGGCIDGDSKCDGQLDCADGSDENEVLCGKPPPIVTSPAPPIISDGCILPEQTKNGLYTLFGKKDAIPGTVVEAGAILTFSCKPGYALYPASNINIYCFKNRWSSALPTCVQTCPARESESVDITCTFEGRQVDCKKPMLEGTKAEMKCKEHYLPEDESRINVIICEDGSWDRTMIKCIPVCGNIIPKGGTPFIVNGDATVAGDFPWHVGIYQLKKGTTKVIHICGGSIINAKIIISAAHCFTEGANGARKPDQYYIGAAKYYRDYDDPRDISAQIVEVQDIIIPKLYRGLESSFTHDIAMVILKKTLIVSNLVQPVCIDWQKSFEDEQLRDNSTGIVVGWGKEKADATIGAEELKQLKVPFIDRDTCFAIVPGDFKPFITTDKFCAGWTTGKSVCQGDSGGGLVFYKPDRNKYFLRGLVSNGPIKGNQCDSRQIGAYTQISQYLDLIRDTEVKYRPK